LRQVNTRCNVASIYYRNRVSGHITQVHTCQPYALFILSDISHERNVPTYLFNKVAAAESRYGNDATLEKRVMVDE
ncbi:hypothetical protein BJV82DRAFT_520094, partial [Fennellomyces sp. T-0311]